MLLSTIAYRPLMANGRPVHWVMARQVPAVLQVGLLPGKPLQADAKQHAHP